MIAALWDNLPGICVGALGAMLLLLGVTIVLERRGRR